MKRTLPLLAALTVILIAIIIMLTRAGEQQDEANENPAPASVSGSISAPAGEGIQADKSYALVSESSSLEWESSRIAGKPHIGNVSLSEGTLLEQEGQIVGGSFTIDMQSITEQKNNERFLKHVRSADFFDIESFPTAGFVLRSVSPSEGENSIISGDLSILGQSHPIEFPARIETSESGKTASAEFSIDRTTWGITFDSGSFFQQLGDRAIKDDIQFRVNLTFQQQ